MNGGWMELYEAHRDRAQTGGCLSAFVAFHTELEDTPGVERAAAGDELVYRTPEGPLVRQSAPDLRRGRFTVFLSPRLDRLIQHLSPESGRRMELIPLRSWMRAHVREEPDARALARAIRRCLSG